MNICSLAWVLQQVFLWPVDLVVIRLGDFQLCQNLGCCRRKCINVFLHDHGESGMGALMDAGFLQRYQTASVLALNDDALRLVSADAVIHFAASLARVSEADLPTLPVEHRGANLAEAHEAGWILNTSIKAPDSRIVISAAMLPS